MMYEQGKDNKQRRKFQECVCVCVCVRVCVSHVIPIAYKRNFRLEGRNKGEEVNHRLTS